MSIAQDPIVIVSAVRTPMGGFQGDLKGLSAPQLGSEAIRAAVQRAGIAPQAVEEVLFGCVLSAGLGQAPARQAALGAGLDKGTRCTTLNKMCGSGMEATILAHDMLLAGSAEVVIAGGMESMSNAPYLLDRARSGYRMGHGKVLDHMFLDGLEDAYDKGRLMGTFAEDCAEANGFTRQAQDDFRRGFPDPCPAGDQGWPVQGRDRSPAGDGRQGVEADQRRRAAAQGQAGQDPHLETGVPRRWHRDCGQLQLDLRRRRGPGADAPLRS